MIYFIDNFYFIALNMEICEWSWAPSDQTR